MATLRKFLDSRNFDWTTGRIIVHEVEDDTSPGWGMTTAAKEITFDNPILDKEFDNGYGGPECPRFVAEDADYIYFPDQYDGSTSCCCVAKDINKYLSIEEPTPYPGG